MTTEAGRPLIKHLQEARRQQGRENEPFEHWDDLPPNLAYLWGWYTDLANARTYGMGPNPIGYAEIQAWAALCAVDVSPWEVGVLRHLDCIWVEVYGSCRSQSQGQ